jgi:hypothetical protein
VPLFPESGTSFGRDDTTPWIPILPGIQVFMLCLFY